MDNHEAVMIGDLEKKSEAFHVVGPKPNKRFPRGGGPRSGGRINSANRCSSHAARLRRYSQCGEPADGDHHLWTKIGTQSAKPSRTASGEVVPQDRGDEQVSQCSPPEWMRQQRLELVEVVQGRNQAAHGKRKKQEKEKKR